MGPGAAPVRLNVDPLVPASARRYIACDRQARFLESRLTHGRIVLINGTSSAGKTTIARAFQELMPEMWVCTGVDVFQSQVHRRWFEHRDGDEPHDAPGWLISWRDGAVDGIQVGPAAQQLMRSMYDGVAAIARGGIDVVLDDVLHSAQRRRSMAAALAGSRAYLVGVRCPLDVAEQRERDRGDRRAGGARLFFDTAHEEMAYDLEIDSASVGPEAAAGLIARRLVEGPPEAIGALVERFGHGP